MESLLTATPHLGDQHVNRILLAACEKLNVPPDRVDAYHIYPTEIVIVASYGKLGPRKYRVPLSELEQQQPVNATAGAKRLAADLGIALDFVTGTGKGGRITIADVRKAAE